MGYWETAKGREYLNEVRINNKVTIPFNEIDFTSFHKILFKIPEFVEDYSSYFLNVLGEIYQKLKTTDSDNKILLEIVYSIYKSVEKLNSVIQNVNKEQNQEINNTIYFRLFSQYIGTATVAFEGEPLSGVQVMGILETRCLDFQNVIILGLNENKWPRTFTAPSFIPFNIRKGFGLPGIDEQDAMYAYYFYRLIQRSKNVTSTYSVVKEGISTGELSRYGYQLKYDSAHNPQMLNLNYSFENAPLKSIQIKSSRQIVDKLLMNNSLKHALSPSAINTYLQCSLKFYFRYAMGLPEPDEIKEEIDGVIFGNVFHDTIEMLYKPFVGKIIEESDIESIRKNKVSITNEITRQIAIHYFKEKTGLLKRIKLEGKTLLIFENIKTYLNRMLEIDKLIAPFNLISLEKKYQTLINVNLNGNNTQIHIGGKIDRVDRFNGTTRVLDYKTGYVKSFSFKTIEELFERDVKDPKKEILQALIYTWALSSESSGFQIQPSIYSLRKLFNENFSANIEWEKNDFIFDDLKTEFELNLKDLIQEIYSVDNTFNQTSHTDKCKYCAYRKICQRF
jgi:CRISPR/Cas system-associated exonuclease Cas4 (RecB family)